MPGLQGAAKAPPDADIATRKRLSGDGLLSFIELVVNY